MKYLVLALCTLMLMGACKKSDDIDKIFEGRTWYFANAIIQGQKVVSEFYQKDNTYILYFGKESLQGTLSTGASFTGTWKADGKEQTMEFVQLEPTAPLNELDNNIFNVLKKIVRYKGDENQIMLIADDQNLINCTSTRTKESNY